MNVKVFNRQGELVGPVESAPVEKTDAEWRAQLTAEQFHSLAFTDARDVARLADPAAG